MSNTDTSIAEASKPDTIQNWLQSDKLRGQIEQALPSGVEIARFMRVLFTQVQKTPKLMQCTRDSLFTAFITSSSLGLDADGRRAHLIPYGQTCQLIIGYQGLVELAYRTGNVSKIHADIVCDNDIFRYDRGEILQHVIDFKKDRGDMYAAYAIVKFKDGTEKAEVMSKIEVDKIRLRSKAGNSGPWQSDFLEMAKKTVFRRLSKWIPLSPEQRDALDKDDDRLTEIEQPAPKKPMLGNVDLTQPPSATLDVTPAPESDKPASKDPAQERADASFNLKP